MEGGLVLPQPFRNRTASFLVHVSFDCHIHISAENI